MINTFSLAFNFFILMDSIGNVPIFLALLKNVNPKRHKWIIFRELVIALIFIILFNFIGDFLMELLNVSLQAVRIAGGIILFLIALKMIFPVANRDNLPSTPIDKEPFIVPFAIPLVAGPAILSAVILYSKQESTFTMISAIFIAWIATTIILIASSLLKRILGLKGLTACERLMGLILTLIAVQMFLEGLDLA